ncbi:MAG: hypothetical protein R3A10_19450 [Caldilineaceae bacterium]
MPLIGSTASTTGTSACPSARASAAARLPSTRWTNLKPSKCRTICRWNALLLACGVITGPGRGDQHGAGGDGQPRGRHRHGRVGLNAIQGAVLGRGP